MNEAERQQQRDPKTHWQDLAQALGAKPVERPEDPQQPVEDPGAQAEYAEVTVPQEEKVPGEPRAEPKQRPASDWYALANSLGIEVEPPAPPEQPKEEEDAAHQQTGEATESGQPDVEQATTESPAMPGSTAESEQEPQVSEEAAAELAEEEAAPPQDTVAQVEEQMTFELQVASVERVTIDQEVVEPVADEELDEPEPEPEPEEPVSDSRARRRRRRRRRPRDVEREEEPEEENAAEAQENSVLEETEVEPGVDEVQEVDDTGVMHRAEELDEELAETAPKRRSRRRRRRSTRETDEPLAKSEPAIEQDIELDETLEDPESENQERGSRAGKEGAKTKHRKIPTWEEAVSVIVASNLSTRSKGGGSKGKSRGSRRRRG